MEHGIEHDVDSIYGVHYTFLNFTAVPMNNLRIKKMMNMTNFLVFNFVKFQGENLLQALMAPEYLKALQ